MVSIDITSSLIFQIINFVVLIFLLNVVLYKPIRGILAERKAKIAQMNSEITASTEGAAAKAQQLEADRAEGRKAGASAREEIKTQARGKEREIINAATAEMEQTVSKLRAQIAEEIGQARAQLKGQVQTFGVELASKILGRSIQ
ncbi:MAG: ATP synthase F0 subunit B [Desulfarculus sp.]|nr:ATP synthase F0 subunit B [Desulfarculus sp.]